MVRILFERPENVYLPEIPAYLEYISRYYPNWSARVSDMEAPLNPLDFDVIWRFMGLDVKGRVRDDQILVQDYNSLSTGRFPALKNWLKKQVNVTPDARVFLNPLVQKGFGFRDAVPSFIRDMGVAEHFYKAVPDPDYDFVYAGKIDRGPEILNFMEVLKDKPELSFLVIGDVDEGIRTKFSDCSNIYFSGRVAYQDVPKYLAKGRFGLNLMPDVFPYNAQTATKVLEYCALGLKLVSNRYSWAQGFAEERAAAIYWLENDFSNLDKNDLERFECKTPDIFDLTWDNVIKTSGVFKFLEEKTF